LIIIGDAGSEVPHSRQKRISSEFSFPHAWHFFIGFNAPYFEKDYMLRVFCRLFYIKLALTQTLNGTALLSLQ
jgi:hypothetical protein